MIFADIVGLDELSADLTLRRVAGDRQQAGPPVRRGGRESRRRAGAHAAQRLPGQLRTERAPHRQRPAHGRLRDRDAPHRRPVQRRDGQQPAAAGRHRHRHGQQRAGRPVQPGLRHVGRGSRSRLSGAERFAAARRLRDVAACTTRCATRDSSPPRARSPSTAASEPIWRLAERQS